MNPTEARIAALDAINRVRSLTTEESGEVVRLVRHEKKHRAFRTRRAEARAAT